MAIGATKKTSQADWHPADILAACHRRGITLKALAKQLGLRDSSTLSKAMVSAAYPLNERRLADALEVDPQDIWPSRYNADGTRKKHGIRALKSTPVSCQHNGNSKRGA